jgi:hypothetical protein
MKQRKSEKKKQRNGNDNSYSWICLILYTLCVIFTVSLS